MPVDADIHYAQTIQTFECRFYRLGTQSRKMHLFGHCPAVEEYNSQIIPTPQFLQYFHHRDVIEIKESVHPLGQRISIDFCNINRAVISACGCFSRRKNSQRPVAGRRKNLNLSVDKGHLRAGAVVIVEVELRPEHTNVNLRRLRSWVLRAYVPML